MANNHRHAAGEFRLSWIVTVLCHNCFAILSYPSVFRHFSFLTTTSGNFTMSIQYSDDSDQIRRISISGRLDIAGTDAIATQFTALAASAPRRVIVDLTAVSFLASIGIRALITNAKALQQRGGKLVLLVGSNESVAKTLEATGIDTLIPMFADAGDAAQAALE